MCPLYSSSCSSKAAQAPLICKELAAHHEHPSPTFVNFLYNLNFLSSLLRLASRLISSITWTDAIDTRNLTSDKRTTTQEPDYEINSSSPNIIYLTPPCSLLVDICLILERDIVSVDPIAGYKLLIDCLSDSCASGFKRLLPWLMPILLSSWSTCISRDSHTHCHRDFTKFAWPIIGFPDFKAAFSKLSLSTARCFITSCSCFCFLSNYPSSTTALFHSVIQHLSSREVLSLLAHWLACCPDEHLDQLRVAIRPFLNVDTVSSPAFNFTPSLLFSQLSSPRIFLRLACNLLNWLSINRISCRPDLTINPDPTLSLYQIWVLALYRLIYFLSSPDRRFDDSFALDNYAQAEAVLRDFLCPLSKSDLTDQLVENLLYSLLQLLPYLAPSSTYIVHPPRYRVSNRTDILVSSLLGGCHGQFLRWAAFFRLLCALIIPDIASGTSRLRKNLLVFVYWRLSIIFTHLLTQTTSYLSVHLQGFSKVPGSVSDSVISKTCLYIQIVLICLRNFLSSILMPFYLDLLLPPTDSSISVDNACISIFVPSHNMLVYALVHLLQTTTVINNIISSPFQTLASECLDLLLPSGALPHPILARAICRLDLFPLPTSSRIPTEMQPSVITELPLFSVYQKRLLAICECQRNCLTDETRRLVSCGQVIGPGLAEALCFPFLWRHRASGLKDLTRLLSDPCQQVLPWKLLSTNIACSPIRPGHIADLLLCTETRRPLSVDLLTASPAEDHQLEELILGGASWVPARTPGSNNADSIVAK
ncbi:unnamed protein product [Protopolystoma xenopodis]|uniref:Uncharacterized protein n=1 Tax=Protopolystoma xenopodis TaxID=117903 RepID=A0A3S4ZQQ8_9PLAT|nr:unnamed protein product [Protopolystoma xenopodis]